MRVVRSTIKCRKSWQETFLKSLELENRSSNPVLILGFTFKENCPDIRNTKVADLFEYLKKVNCEVDVTDYFASAFEVESFYNIDRII